MTRTDKFYVVQAWLDPGDGRPRWMDAPKQELAGWREWDAESLTRGKLVMLAPNLAFSRKDVARSCLQGLKNHPDQKFELRLVWRSISVQERVVR